VQPPWAERPRGVLLGGVGEELLLARTAAVAVALSRLAASSDGFAATLTVLSASRDEDELEESPFGWGPWRRRSDPAQLLRFGVRYPDGSKAELRGPGPASERRGRAPEGPVISGGGGGGGGGEWRHEMWFWPLPGSGTLTFAVEWPARSLELALHELDTGPIRDAAGRAQTLFAGDEMNDSPGLSVSPMHFFNDEPG
jgi:hypothetical protein